MGFLFATRASALHGATMADRDIKPENAPPPDPMARPHVDHHLPTTLGHLRLMSAGGPLESLRLIPLDDEHRRVVFDRATGEWLASSARLTPSQARALASLLTRYADTHEETPE